MPVFQRIKTIVGYVASSAAETLFSSTLGGELLSRLYVNADGTVATSSPPDLVSNVTFSGSTVTVTTSAEHGYNTSDPVTIAGVLGLTSVNGAAVVVTAPSSTTFTFTAGVTPTGSYTSGGQVQRTWGTGGLGNEGIWSLIINGASKVGLSIRGRQGGTGQLLLVVDYKNQPIFGVAPAGGAYVAGDNFRVFNGGDIFNPWIKLRQDGSVQMAKGDAANGSGVLAIGNATFVPNQQPDGSHTLDGSATTAGTLQYSVAGRLFQMNQSGSAEEQNTPGVRRVTQVYKDVGLATVTTVGKSAHSLTGTATTADNALTYSGVQLTTAATIGSVSGVAPAAYNQTYPGWAPMYWARICTDPSAVTNVRYWCGLVSADPSGSATPGSINMAAFRYDTAADGTAFWRCVTSNGTTSTVTATTQSIAANTFYDLRIEVNQNNNLMRFSIATAAGSESVVATMLTTLPTYTVLLAPVERCTALAASARSIIFSKSVLSHIG
jgi:hypothetical protein